MNQGPAEILRQLKAAADEVSNYSATAANIQPPDDTGDGGANTAADRDAMNHTQATRDADTWDVGDTETGGCVEGVEVRVLTDLEYNTGTHVLGYRTRTLKFDPRGYLISVTAEDAAVTAVATAAACP